MPGALSGAGGRAAGEDVPTALSPPRAAQPGTGGDDAPTAARPPVSSPAGGAGDDQPTMMSARAPGFRIGPYEVEAELGRGGMGVVYLARDPRLDRRVALKGITESFAADAESMARFQREARTLASLNHPNIAAIYGLEEHQGATYLVLELVEGLTLSDKLKQGQLGWEESCRVGVQIAQALEAAHQRGIIHRDLKPANIKFASEGVLKILDFGLAKQAPAAGSAPGADHSISLRTEAGAIMGTPGYMSPEQARGQPVDRRCDMWAFGCILYECLTGRRTYSGPTATDAIAATLMLDPDWSSMPDGTPARLDELIRRCLKKNLDDRLKDAGEAAGTGRASGQRRRRCRRGCAHDPQAAAESQPSGQPAAAGHEFCRARPRTRASGPDAGRAGAGDARRGGRVREDTSGHRVGACRRGAT